MTPLQRALGLVVGAYVAATRALDARERDLLRDILCARIAADYLREQGHLLDDAADDREAA